MMNNKLTYKDAGVDTKEGERAVLLMKEHVKKTFNKNVLTGLGSFGSLFNLDLEGITEPVLVSGTDGVGTKLKIAFLTDIHDTVGQDCVAMCVNDILCQGAKPLFFLDYIATGKVKAEKVADIVKGIADGCVLAECALIGGETAEMPGFYQDGEYDMAGFAVGIVDRKKIIDGSKIAKDDVIIGIPSSGIHSNGYSLVRKLFFETLNMKVSDQVSQLGMTLGEALITTTKIYAKVCNSVLSNNPINGIVNKEFTDEGERNLAILKALKKEETDLVVLAGYMNILAPELVKEFKGRIINIHPSLIPKFCGGGFYGLKVHEAVINAGEKESGATVHYVDEGIDTGEIIIQEKVAVKPGDDPEILAARVLEIEHKILPKAILIWQRKGEE